MTDKANAPLVARTLAGMTPAQIAATQAVLARITQLAQTARQHAPRQGALGIGSEQTRHEAQADALHAFRAAFWAGHPLQACVSLARERYVLWVEKFNARCCRTARIHVPLSDASAPDVIWWAYTTLHRVGF